MEQLVYQEVVSSHYYVIAEFEKKNIYSIMNFISFKIFLLV